MLGLAERELAEGPTLPPSCQGQVANQRSPAPRTGAALNVGLGLCIALVSGLVLARLASLSVLAPAPSTLALENRYCPCHVPIMAGMGR